MKRKKYLALVCVLVMIMALASCTYNSAQGKTPPKGQIYLYGEIHGIEKILNKELELWGDYYNNKGMRHLFIEHPYYTAEFLNLWMQADDDVILDELYEDWKETPSYNPAVKEFYKEIKDKYPDTIFHGTDVGHQYQSIGKRFLEYLVSNNLEDSEQYHLAQEAIEQGRCFSLHNNYVYRENMMASNFIREFDKLSGESIMGIYGAAHTGLDAMDFTKSVPCMANQLKEHYGDIVNSEDISYIAKEIDPIRVDTITVSGKDYEASYFGVQDLRGYEDYDYREYWRLENAYDDFKNKPKTGFFLPYDYYLMNVEIGQVFVIDDYKTDGSVLRKYYRSDGTVSQSSPSTVAFTVE